jgi:hypothetical protein
MLQSLHGGLHPSPEGLPVLMPLGASSPLLNTSQDLKRAGLSVGELEQHASIARVAQKVRDIKAAKPTTKLLDPSELPQPERATRCAFALPPKLLRARLSLARNRAALGCALCLMIAGQHHNKQASCISPCFQHLRCS